MADFFHVFGKQRHIVVTDHFRNAQSQKKTDGVGQRVFRVSFEFRHGKFSRGDIRPRRGDAFFRFGNAGNIIILRFVEKRVFDERTCRNDTDHVAIHQPFACLRIGKLFADRHLFAERDEFRDIRIGGVERNTAHRRAFFQAAVLSRKREIEKRRHLDRVVEKHLVKIPEAVKQNTIFILLFHREVMLHHIRRLWLFFIFLFFVFACVSHSFFPSFNPRFFPPYPLKKCRLPTPLLPARIYR